jgi:tetratricopeptide (TPR) repeat protein
MNDPNTLGTLLAACTNENLIVVMSLNQAEAVLPELQQHKYVQSIYFLSKQTHLPEWINDYDKVIEIYQNIESIRDHLIETLPHVPSRVISMEITSKDSTSDRPFTYCHLLKETILCQDDESDLRKDMLAFCRIHYAHNQEEVHEIDEFEKSFTDTHSIQWYTRHCFLTKILSRAFRTQEIDLLFKMRYFIQSLHKQIQSIAVKEPTTAYAILNVEQETIRKFQENINGLVLFRSFLPATFERPTSMEYQNKDTQRYLVFSIRLGPDCAANIEQLRPSDCKIDLLINIDTVFRVVSINEGENEVHIVNLESVPHDDSHFQQLTESLRKEIKAPVVILQLTKLLLETDHYWESDYLTELIYQDKSFEGDGTLLASLAAAHHLLGNVDETKRDFEAARYQFFKSLRVFHLFLAYYHPLLSSSYNNIGSMFLQDNHHECAIKFHEMALECQLKASSPNMDAVATYSANIGAVYIDQKNYTEAMKHLKRAVMILEKMPVKDNSKRLISVFQKISSCFWRTNEPKEALEYYKKTLDLQLKLPNPLPHPLSVTYYNLSTAYTRIGDYDEAVACAEKSVEYLRMISENHPELKENQAQLEIVRQKQWLKQVLSA